MRFSATEAALEGFRIGRHKPMVMLSWAAASLAISLLSSLAMVGMFGGALNELTEAQGAGADPGAALGAMAVLGKVYLFLIPVALVIAAVFTTAV